MAKVFTITEGIENLGALKSGGQGSVYKARKTGEITTAIKILPTPIYSETDDDKHFTSFRNEVEKLKKVNEIPNPNVVSIIASGITSSGNFPYIEMEYIEGPDLGELLTSPHDAIFTIKETIKVAEQLANALAHCHRANIKHGDIKSNNVKFNQRTGNYILLDFGLSVMSDEQRRTSIRYAGAIEFMAPEQSKGETLFETDVYSFGVILFELLAGTVPFPLANKGEMARNAVMVAHMETLPPDIVMLRRQAVPSAWNDEKKEREMQIPFWLLNMVGKCLEKDPAKRFRNGNELYDFIQNGIVAEERIQPVDDCPAKSYIPQIDESVWKKEILKLQSQLVEKEELLTELQYEVQVKNTALSEAQYYSASKASGISKSLFFVVLIIAVGLAGFAAYHQIHDTNTPMEKNSGIPQSNLVTVADSTTVPVNKFAKKQKGKSKKTGAPSADDSIQPATTPDTGPVTGNTNVTVQLGTEFDVINTVYFYNSPDEFSRQNNYLTKGRVVLKVINEKNGFIKVVHNNNGKITRGWLPKQSVVEVNEY